MLICSNKFGYCFDRIMRAQRLHTIFVYHILNVKYYSKSIRRVAIRVNEPHKPQRLTFKDIQYPQFGRG